MAVSAQIALLTDFTLWHGLNSKIFTQDFRNYLIEIGSGFSHAFWPVGKLYKQAPTEILYLFI